MGQRACRLREDNEGRIGEVADMKLSRPKL